MTGAAHREMIGPMQRGRVWAIAGVGAAFWLVGCGGGEGFSLVAPSPRQQQNVMVIDEGFDLSISELRGRVAAGYTETCADETSGGPDASSSPDAAAADAGAAPDGGGADAGASFDQMKQALLAALSVPDDSCHLTVGIGTKPDPFAPIAPYRTRWNAMVRANQVGAQAFTQAVYTQITTAIDNELQTDAYHGTATAGTVVHDNPTVRLVLIERELASDAEIQSSFSCFVQSEIDQAVELISDPQVNAALVNQPVEVEGDLATARSKYDVGLVNESFGSSSRAALDAMQTAANCPTTVDLSAYFSLLDQIQIAHAATLTGPAVLTVQAAGNDGSEIDSGADSLACDLGDPLSLLVGSYDPGNQVRNTFSDFGACVDAYAPGQSVVAPYAGDWLLPREGTSFSAPMAARLVSLDTTAAWTPALGRTNLLAARVSDGSLPISLFPDDFFYTPTETPTAALIAGAPRARAAPRSLTRVDLHRVLHPLNLLRSLRRR
jgi:Subtilase family